MGSSTYRLRLCLQTRGGDGSTSVGATVTPTDPENPSSGNAVRPPPNPPASPAGGGAQVALPVSNPSATGQVTRLTAMGERPSGQINPSGPGRSYNEGGQAKRRV